MSHTTSWPTSTLHGRPTPAALTVAAFLTDRPVRPGGRGDAIQRTHTRLRCSSLHGDRVHRISGQARLFYTTACGLRVPKTAGTRTAADVDCQHHGCRARGEAS